MSVTRIGPVRVVGQSLLAVVGPVPFSVTPTPLQTVQQSSAQSSQENTVRETRCSVRTGPGAGCARDRSSSCTLGSQQLMSSKPQEDIKEPCTDEDQAKNETARKYVAPSKDAAVDNEPDTKRRAKSKHVLIRIQFK